MTKSEITMIIKEKISDLVVDLENEMNVLVDFETKEFFEYGGKMICRINFEYSE